MIYVPLERLKTPPERIATELVNLTSESVGKFLRTHGHRLAFCASNPQQPSVLSPYEVVNPETMDRRESDPETGEPIPGTKRELKKWKGPTIPTSGMPRDTRDQLKAIRESRRKIEKRREEDALLKWVALLRGMWTPRTSAAACQAIEQIFSAERLHTGSLPERPAVQITRRGLSVESRDLLDTVAWTILEAATRGWLRCCKNRCPAPLFVALKPGQHYCFKCGGVEAERRRKREWARRRRA
jgi:hypothetical protein